MGCKPAIILFGDLFSVEPAIILMLPHGPKILLPWRKRGKKNKKKIKKEEKMDGQKKIKNKRATIIFLQKIGTGFIL